jgi:hypothetical protein
MIAAAAASAVELQAQRTLIPTAEAVREHTSASSKSNSCCFVHHCCSLLVLGHAAVCASGEGLLLLLLLTCMVNVLPALVTPYAITTAEGCLKSIQSSTCVNCTLQRGAASEHPVPICR